MIAHRKKKPEWMGSEFSRQFQIDCIALKTTMWQQVIFPLQKETAKLNRGRRNICWHSIFESFLDAALHYWPITSHLS